MKTKTKKIIFPIVLLLIIAGLIMENQLRSPAEPSSIKSDNETAEEVPETRQPGLNGVLMEANIADSRPIGVIIENHPSARPQSGLQEAQLIYETVAEGGITRFLAVYQSDEKGTPVQIGPVRSARSYFADIGNELGSLFIHVGGSDDALQNIARNKWPDIFDINEYSYGSYFIRTNRPAPHNVYTTLAQMRSLITAKQVRMDIKPGRWLFKDDGDANTALPAASNITVNFSTASYGVAYAYDATRNDYARSLAGKPHTDAATQEQLRAKNIIVQEVRVTGRPNDPKLRVDVALTGSGNATIFRDGKAIAATWKHAPDGRTRYYDPAGTEIALNRGQTWIELVPASLANRLSFQ